MYGQVHENRVFYKDVPARGNKFRQIALHELDQFIVIVGEGEVIHDVPRFQAENADAEAHLYGNLKDARDDVEVECRRAEQEGWIRYAGG
jgi:hypothetical protein